MPEFVNSERIAPGCQKFVTEGPRQDATVPRPRRRGTFVLKINGTRCAPSGTGGKVCVGNLESFVIYFEVAAIFQKLRPALGPSNRGGPFGVFDQPPAGFAATGRARRSVHTCSWRAPKHS